MIDFTDKVVPLVDEPYYIIYLMHFNHEASAFECRDIGIIVGDEHANRRKDAFGFGAALLYRMRRVDPATKKAS